MTVTNKRRSLFIEDELWADCNRMAARVQLETGVSTTVSEFIRRALQNQIDAGVEASEWLGDSGSMKP